VNYIPLNQVTRQIAYPIPRCDPAVNLAFGIALFFWLFDAHTGYHQLAISPESQEKLAFQSTDAIKWTYTVMPFGPTNGPVTFTEMIHDLDSAWKDLAARSGLNVDDNTNTNIIVDDIFNWAVSFDSALQYMECQLQICKAYHLTLSLKKVTSSSNVLNLKDLMYRWMAIAPRCLNINCWITGPHQSLFMTLQASLVLFSFTAHSSLTLKSMQSCFKKSCSMSIRCMLVISGPLQPQPHLMNYPIAFHNPCLCHFNHRKLTILRTDFLSQGFGYAVCQPDDNNASLQLVAQCMSKNGFGLMSTSKGTLHPVAFGSVTPVF
jgi:hypothetical protein